MLTITLSISLIFGFIFSRYIFLQNSNGKVNKKNRTKQRIFLTLGTFSFVLFAFNIENFTHSNSSVKIFELILIFIYNFALTVILLHLSAYDMLYLTQNKVWIYRLILFLIGLSLAIIFLRVSSSLLYNKQTSLEFLPIGNFYNIINFAFGFILFRVLEFIIKQKSFTLDDVLLISSFGLVLNSVDYLLFLLFWIITAGLIAILAILYKKDSFKLLIPISPILLISYLVIFGYTDIIKVFLNI